MQRLLDDFATLFDLDCRVRGKRLGDLLARAIDALEQRPLPDWGRPGPARRHESASGVAFDFHYSPHLFPDMALSLRLAHKLQFYMLPRSVPAGSPLSIAAVLESYCHLSGDLFGWEMLDDGRFLIWIVDLSGHGVRAGLASAVLRVLVDNLMERRQVDSLVTELNETFVRSLREPTSSLFATGFFMALSGTGEACFTSAGHPPMLLRRREGRIEALRSNAIPLGMFPGKTFPASETRLDVGDTLLLFTDGVVETVNAAGEHFGQDRLREHLRREPGEPRALTDSLYETISSYQDMARLDDDVTFVAARRE